jgi:hypothetical protein
VDLRAGLDDLEKILDPTGTRNPTPSIVQPVASRYTDYICIYIEREACSGEDTLVGKPEEKKPLEDLGTRG